MREVPTYRSPGEAHHRSEDADRQIFKVPPGRRLAHRRATLSTVAFGRLRRDRHGRNDVCEAVLIDALLMFAFRILIFSCAVRFRLPAVAIISRAEINRDIRAPPPLEAAPAWLS